MSPGMETPAFPASYHSISRPYNVVTTGLPPKTSSREPSAEQPSVTPSDQPWSHLLTSLWSHLLTSLWSHFLTSLWIRLLFHLLFHTLYNLLASFQSRLLINHRFHLLINPRLHLPTSIQFFFLIIRRFLLLTDFQLILRQRGSIRQGYQGNIGVSLLL